MASAGTLGTSFETILLMTDTLTMTAAQAVTNLVVGSSGLSGGKVLTLPTVQAMVASQNLQLQVSNLSSSGGTITLTPATGDGIGGGPTTVPVARGVLLKHDGLKTWFTVG